MSVFWILSSCFLVIAMIWQRVESVDSYGKYYSEQGQSCREVYDQRGLVGSTHTETGNSPALFEKLGVGCNVDNRNWWAQDQPMTLETQTTSLPLPWIPYSSEQCIL